jgi:hypothetical protein
MIAFFLDADNLSSSAGIDQAFQILNKLEGPIAIRRAYGAPEKLKGLEDALRTWAIRPFANLALSKNTTDVSLAVDAMEIACLTPKPRLVVIGSGDADFVPLVLRLRERGIKAICVCEQGKMAEDAIPAYDEVVYVTSSRPKPAIKNKALDDAAVTVRAKKKPGAKTAGSKDTEIKKASVKEVAMQKTVKAPPSRAAGDVTADEILSVAPELRKGEWMHLGNVVKILHDQNLLSKNAASTKLFKRFPTYFELSPQKQPSQIRWIYQDE